MRRAIFLAASIALAARLALLSDVPRQPDGLPAVSAGMDLSAETIDDIAPATAARRVAVPLFARTLPDTPEVDVTDGLDGDGDLRLLGIIADGRGGASALVQLGTDGPVSRIATGGRIGGGVVAEVSDRSITLSQDGRRETILLEPKALSARTDSSER